MAETHQILIVIGGLLLIGLAAHVAGRRTALPRVSLLILSGIAVGPAGLGILPDAREDWFPTVANMALAMVGFLLGERLHKRRVQAMGAVVLGISLAVVGVTALIVSLGLILLGIHWAAAVLLGGIATSTAPAATLDVVEEGRAKGLFTDALLAIVAADDAWGLILFSCILAVSETIVGPGMGWSALLLSLWEIGGAILVGLMLGVPMALLTGRIEPGKPTLAEALGFVFLCGGVGIWLNVSFLLASITLGAMVANLAKHHTRPFHAIEGIDEPFLILFFVLSGASLEVGALVSVGLVGATYVALRAVSRIVGALAGGALAGASHETCRLMGLALMPQAGVALGMALLATQRFPELSDTILPIAIASTVVFELVGPAATRVALRRVGEAQ